MAPILLILSSKRAGNRALVEIGGEWVKDRYRELLLQTLEIELSSIVVYSTALMAVHDEGLREEWTKCLDEKGRNIEIIYDLFETLGLAREEQTQGRLLVRHVGESLVEAIDVARITLSPEEAEIVACECVVVAETRDHANWRLLGEIGQRDSAAGAIRRAWEQVDGPHLSNSWCHHLWIASLDMPAHCSHDARTKQGSHNGRRPLVAD